MRAFTRVRVLYMINYRVHVYKITRYRRIHKVRVGVGPEEFKLNHTSTQHSIFMGRVLFLQPNQQCQRTEGILFAFFSFLPWFF